MDVDVIYPYNLLEIIMDKFSVQVSDKLYIFLIIYLFYCSAVKFSVLILAAIEIKHSP